MLTSLALVSALISSAQDPMMPPLPKAELDALSFLTGRYRGTGTGSDPTGKAMKMTGTSNGVMEFDRWLNLESSYDMGDGGKLNGRFSVTYNASKKRYDGVWCDNMSETPMKASGYIEGKYLVMFSEEFEMAPGQKTTFKIVYSKESSRAYNFSIKMKAENAWVPLMTMNYKK
ncbi:MAG: DUF1579 family protein [Fimbriimonadaceae bacterium]